MTIVSAPFTPQIYSPTAQTEQELAYELLSEQVWSEEAYLVFTEAFNRPMELSNGRLVVLPMPTLTHQRVLKRFADRVTDWLKENNVGEILFAPHPIRLWPGKYREPDVMLWLIAHRDRMGERESGPPDVAVEIVSPTNELHDTDTKVAEYAQAGIPEYWIIYPQLRQIAVHQLEGRAYKLAGLFRSGDRVRSTILKGFELAVDELFPVES